MNIILWVGQGLLALIFLYSGANKSIYSQQQLIGKGQTGVAGFGQATIRLIGISEILGAAGLILPWWTGVAPFLTPVAAACLALIMVLAAPIHYRLSDHGKKKQEMRNVVTNVVFLVIAVLVAWGRWREI